MARKLIVELVGDASKLTKSLNDAQSKTASFGDKMQSVGSKMTRSVTLPIVGIGIASVKAASDMEESMSKVTVVFDKQAKEIKDWSKNAAKDMGVSQQAALEAAGTFGNLFRAMSIATPQAADMSKNMIQLASDLASFNNASPEETLQALKSGLVGETEPLRRFGVNLNEARIKAEALSLGLAKAPVEMHKVTAASNKLEAAQKKVNEAIKEHGADSLQARQAMDQQAAAQVALDKALAGGNVTLDAAQKAQAAYSLIMKDTTLAQGDFNRTADGLANSTRTASAQLSDAAAKLGAQFLPAVTDVAGFLTGTFIPALDSMTGGNGALTLLGLAAAGPVLNAVGKLKNGIVALNLTLDATAVKAAAALGAIGVVIGGIQEIRNTEGGIFEKILGGSPVSRGLDKINPFGRKHTGGVVPGPTGHPVPIMALGGETVGRSGGRGGGGGGITIVVQGSVISERDLGRTVADALRDNNLLGVTV